MMVNKTKIIRVKQKRPLIVMIGSCCGATDTMVWCMHDSPSILVSILTLMDLFDFIFNKKNGLIWSLQRPKVNRN